MPKDVDIIGAGDGDILTTIAHLPLSSYPLAWGKCRRGSTVSLEGRQTEAID